MQIGVKSKNQAFTIILDPDPNRGAKNENSPLAPFCFVYKCQLRELEKTDKF